MTSERQVRSLDEVRLRRMREKMVAEQLGEISDVGVREAMARVPRHMFVPPALQHLAYEDTPLPIGYGQTISQPFMVATLLEAMELRGGQRVLDVGAGSGYQAALLSDMGATVSAIEIVPELATLCAANLERAGFRDVTVICGDGSHGYAPAAPYDAIVVAAGASHIPLALLEQLVDDGRLVIPLSRGHGEVLHRVRKRQHGRIAVERLCDCRFVPLIESTG